jgi:hypothetical protein
MGWKYRKRISVFPGFKLNLSKSGMSATIGMKGFSVNMGKNGTYLNTGIPGTGIYDRIRLDNKKSDGFNSQNNNTQNFPTSTEDNPYEIKSFQPELLSSEGLFGLKESIIKAREIKNELKEESEKAKSKKNGALFLAIITHILIFGIFIKWFRDNYKQSKADAEDAEQTYNNFKLDIDFNMDEILSKEYLLIKECYDKVKNSNKIWDITSSQAIDRVKERSSAGSTVTRVPVTFSYGSLDYINSKYEAFKLQNANGSDLYIYPGFIIIPSERSNDFAIIDLKEIEIEHHDQRFVENEVVPSDTKIVGQTWEYVNKNGSPDKRYSYNPEIPIVLYYKFTLKTTKGLHECFQVSFCEAGNIFCRSIELYRDSLRSMKWGKEGKEGKSYEQPLLDDEQKEIKKNDVTPIIENIPTISEEEHLIELRKLLILETELDPVLIAMDDANRRSYVEHGMELIKKENLEYQLHYLESVRKRIKGYKKNKK